MNADRTIARETLAEMVAAVDPDWRIESADLAEGGYLSVYHLTVETDAGSRDLVLKAPPDGDDHGIALEARLLSVIAGHSSAPVPAVLGAVDEHDSLPAPYFLMRSVPGRTVHRWELDAIDPGTVESIARQCGRHLASLHGIDAVDAFGYLEPTPDRTYRGEVPAADPGSIRVSDPVDSWRERLRTDAEAIVDGIEGSRFRDLAPAVAESLDDRIDAVADDADPVLAHVDNSIENLRFDPGTGEVTAVLDWAFTVAATPAYDLAYAEHSLAGGAWSLVPSTPDYRDRIRAGLVEGYRAVGSPAVLERFERERDCYELTAVARLLGLFEDWFAARGPDDEAIVEAAAENARGDIRRLLKE